MTEHKTPRKRVLIGGFVGADGIAGPPLSVAVEPTIKSGYLYIGKCPPEGWTYAKDGYAFLEIDGIS